MSSNEGQETPNNSEKRVRKSVQRLSEVFNKEYIYSKEKKILVLDGEGVRLGEIERVKDAYHRSRISKDIAKDIHMLCYKTLGQSQKRNSNIRNFNGFSKEVEDQVKRRVASCEKLNMSKLKVMCDLFNIPTSGKQKKDISTSLIDYLQCPIETGSKHFRTSSFRQKRKGKKTKLKEKKSKTTKKIVSDDKIKESENSESDSMSQVGSEVMIKKEFENDKRKSNNNVKKVQKEKDIQKKKRAVPKKDNQKNLVHNFEKGTDESESLSDVDSDEIVKTKITLKKSKEKIGKNIISKKKEKVNDDNVVVKKSKDELAVRDYVSGTEQMSEEKVSISSHKVCKEEVHGNGDISDDTFIILIEAILKDADLNIITLNKVCDEIIQKFPEANLESMRSHIKQLVKKVIEGN